MGHAYPIEHSGVENKSSFVENESSSSVVNESFFVENESSSSVENENSFAA